MDVEKILKESWELTQKHWKFVAIVALIAFGINIVLAMVIAGSVAGGLGGLALSTAGTDLATGVLGGAGLAALAFGAIVTLLVAPWITGATAHAGKMVVENKTANNWAPYQAALGQYVTFLLLSIVLAVALGIGFMLFILPGIVLAVMLAMSPMAVAVDNASVGDALKASWNIGLKHFWTILLVGVIIAVVSFVLGLVTSFIPVLPTYLSMVVGVYGAIALALMYKAAK